MLKSFLHCPLCGSPYPKTQPDPYAQRCDRCGYIYHENLRTATGAIIIQDNKILLVKRAHEPRQNTWDVPGGFTEPHESPAQSLQREVKEELGVDCTVAKLIGAYGPNPYPYLGKLNYTCDLFYYVTLQNNRLKPQDDVAGYQWFPLNKLPPPQTLAFPSLRAVLKDITPVLPPPARVSTTYS
jgi:NAD+ diphosphatase